MKLPWRYLLFFSTVMVAWLAVNVARDSFGVAAQNWPMAVTMFFGAFIAGASSEGGGAVAFPVMTLLLHIGPNVARNFSLCIQSFGMTSASLLIVDRKIPIEKSALLFATLGGVPGFLLSTYLVVPHTTPGHTKLFFVSLWLAFGVALWLANRREDREALDEIPDFGPLDAAKLFCFGVVGGGVSALLGNGIDIVTFTLLTLHFDLSEKVATPTSVLLMTINTIFGSLWHLLVVGDLQPEVLDYLLAAVPVVIVMAPVGAWAISHLPRTAIARFLYAVIAVQFVGALLVLQPALPLLLFCGLVFLGGMAVFATLLIWQRGRSALELERGELGEAGLDE